MFPKDSWEVGDLVVVSGVSGIIKEFSPDAKRIHVEHTNNEGEKYMRWHDMDVLPPYELATSLTPATPPPPNGEQKPSAIVKRNSFKQGQRVRIVRDLAHHVKPLEVGDEGKVLDGRFFSDKYETWHFDDYMVDGVKRDALDFAEVIELKSAAIVDDKALIPHPPLPDGEGENAAKFEEVVRWGMCPVCGHKKELHGGLCVPCNEAAATGEIATVKEPRLVRGGVLRHKALNYQRVIESVEGYTLTLMGQGKVQWDASVWEVVAADEGLVASLLTKFDAQFGRIAELEEKLRAQAARIGNQAESVASEDVSEKDAEIERLSKLLAEAETRIEVLEKANKKQSDLLKAATASPAPSSLEERAAALFSAPVAKDDTQEVSTVEIRLATLEEQVAQMTKIVQLYGVNLDEVG